MDRFTAGVVAVVLGLVVLSVAVVALGGGRGEPGDDTTPRGVVVLYLRSLREGDQDRAYELLSSDLRARVSRDEFIRLASFLQNDRRRYEVGQAAVDGMVARVPVVYLSEGGLFGPRQATTETAGLLLEGGRWRISAPPEPFFPDRPGR
ncbi:MAG: hypothetical protein RMM58_09565 [Chloroflexota bacterium]|nr:hypothetical protein [Dehalococcoidia bacterium]MDW8254115.1 hypothetical protein [Chloroflexota bacterium]